VAARGGAERDYSGDRAGESKAGEVVQGA